MSILSLRSAYLGDVDPRLATRCVHLKGGGRVGGMFGRMGRRMIDVGSR